ncbi:MAG TPA: PAS domain S-box protein [Chitinivibrionales bacterium]|nr:PAS domain S-box protein [Chitinivibrionales bacterium]
MAKPEKKPRLPSLSINKALLSSQKKYELFFNNLRDASSLFEMRDDGLPGRYLEVNDTLCKWLGYTREELLDLSPLDISEKKEEAINREVSAVFAGKGSHLIERTLVAKDGRKIPVEVNFHYINYDGKKAVLSISRDISERKKAVASLCESEEKFARVFHSSPVAMSITRQSDGMFLHVNSKLLQLTGFDQNELIGKTTAELGLWDDEPRKAMLKDLAASKSLHTIEVEIGRKNGGTVPVLWSAELVQIAGSPCVLASALDITEYKKAMEALRESEEKFRSLIEQNLEGFALIDEKGMVIEWNAALEDITGLARHDVLGRPLWEVQSLMRPDENTASDHFNRREKMLSVLKSGRTPGGRKPYETKIVKPNGTRAFIQQTIFPIKTYSGFRLGAITRDITQQRHAEEALRESEEKFRSMIEQNLEGFSLIDETGTVTEWNTALEEMTGLKRGDVIGKAMWDVQAMMRPAEVKSRGFYERIREMMRAMIKSGDNPMLGKPFETPIQKPDGSSAIIQQVVFPIKTKNGFRFGSIKRDVTSQKHAEDALRDSEQRFKTLIENAFEGIAVVDRNGTVKYSSPGLTRILGFTPEDRYGANVFKNIHPDDSVRAQEAFGRALAHPLESFPIFLRYRRSDGSWRWLECVGKNLLDASAINGIVINYRDVSERKRAEEDQQRFEQQMQKVEKLESLGILAGGIAHDFNNLLTGIFGYIDVARMFNSSGAADKVAMNLSKALDVFNRARALTQQLLTFSKGGAPVKKTLSLPPLLTSTTNFVLSGSSVSARFGFPDGLWPCEVDENQFGQVIDNILINARQAMPTGGSVVVTAENFPKGQPVPAPLAQGDYVRISIRDFGIGISKDHLPHIFDPFFTTKQEGSGLGLATAYSIIRKHEGIIEAESELGIGSTFYIYLPAHPSAAAEPLSTRIKKHRGQGVVLVMDDEDFVRDVAAEMLKTMGYTADPAKNGAEAVEKYQKAFSSPVPYALVILDLTVPAGMGGKDTLKDLLKINPAVIAIAASGFSEDPVMTDPPAFGFKGKLRKPFTKEELGDVLERVVGPLK